MPRGFGGKVTWGGRVKAMVLFRWVKVYGRCCGGEGKKGGKMGYGSLGFLRFRVNKRFKLITKSVLEVTRTEGNDGIITVNVIPPDHVDEVPVVELNQHDDVPVVPEPVLEDENEPKLTYPYEEMDPLNPSPPASESEPDDEIKVEKSIEHKDETVPASVHE
nr:hypothetical protein [Tanacetum cinerariifolium]